MAMQHETIWGDQNQKQCEWLLVRTEITQGAKYLYLILNAMKTIFGHAAPAKATLCTYLDKDLESTQSYIDELVHQGLIKLTWRPQQSNIYNLLIHPWMIREPDKPDPRIEKLEEETKHFHRVPNYKAPLIANNNTPKSSKGVK